MYACWVRPSHPPLSSELGSAFLLFPRGCCVILTSGPWILLSSSTAWSCVVVTMASQSASLLLSALTPVAPKLQLRIQACSVLVP